MSQNVLDTSIEFLKGVGPKRAEILKKEAEIYTWGDLLNYFPFRYIDRSQFNKVNELNDEMPFAQLKGRITFVEELGAPRSRRLVAHFTDATGEIQLVWFKGIRWIKPSLKENQEYIVFGKPNAYKGRVNIPHPEIDKPEDVQKTGSSLQSVYPSTEKLSGKGLNSRGFEKLHRTLSEHVKGVVKENLSAELLDNLRLMPREESFRQLHFPTDHTSLQKAQFRLKFEELFYIQLELLRMKVNRQQKVRGFVFETVGEYFNCYFNEQLGFELTEAQKRVIKEIRSDMGNGQQMNRLLQGDVGSGKTIVALLVMLIALDNGYQSSLMAPTEILANQHYENLKEPLAAIGVTVGLLTGSTKTAERKDLLSKLAEGELHIIIGTHSLLEERVQFHNFGMAVIDEQHRFGVAQRAALWKKSKQPPHVLVMTATPIPRTLAMTFYGDLDVSVIDELPPGRKPIKTVHRFDSSRLKVFGFMKEEIGKGRQVYVVYPLIHESEKLDLKDLHDGYESISRAFPDHKVSIVHGQMKPADKDYEMHRFVKQGTHILVATTVIEVGVNVPNASVMVIESAERFGLSQLHQLRGRVGRGAEQSFCILMTGNELTQDAKERMQTMVRTNDGFEIAEVDLKLRGPGNLMGTQQSGLLGLKLADLARDQQILQVARDSVIQLLNDDPGLTKKHNQPIAIYYRQMKKGRMDWSRIS